MRFFVTFCIVQSFVLSMFGYRRSSYTGLDSCFTYQLCSVPNIIGVIYATHIIDVMGIPVSLTVCYYEYIIYLLTCILMLWVFQSLWLSAIMNILSTCWHVSWCLGYCSLSDCLCGVGSGAHTACPKKIMCFFYI